MSCNCCNCSLINGFYKCDINDYRIVDESDNLVKIICENKIKYALFAIAAKMPLQPSN